jgi:hypothetical protein
MSVKFQITLPEGLAMRLRQRSSASGGDPFLSITNLVDAPDTDFSERADEILYK